MEPTAGPRRTDDELASDGGFPLSRHPSRIRKARMLRWFQALMPREDRFFDLYNRHAQTLVQGAEALRELLEGGPGAGEAARKVIAYESQADVIARDVLLLVRRTFITPFDRGDIKDLINTLDDTIDQMQKTAKAVLLFEVERLEPGMAAMGDRTLQAAKPTLETLRLLGS